MSASFDTIPLIPAPIVECVWPRAFDLTLSSSIARLPGSGCRGKVGQIDFDVLDTIVVVVLVLEQVDNVGTHLLVLVLF